MFICSLNYYFYLRLIKDKDFKPNSLMVFKVNIVCFSAVGIQYFAVISGHDPLETGLSKSIGLDSGSFQKGFPKRIPQQSVPIMGCSFLLFLKKEISHLG